MVNFNGIELRAVNRLRGGFGDIAGHAVLYKREIKILRLYAKAINLLREEEYPEVEWLLKLLCHELEHTHVYEALLRIGIPKRKARSMARTSDEEQLCSDIDLWRGKHFKYWRMVGLPFHYLSLKCLPRKWGQLDEILEYFSKCRGNFAHEDHENSEWNGKED